MMRGYVTPTEFAPALMLAAALAAPHGAAQTAPSDQAEQADTIEEIVVMARTGSRISRQGDSPSPLTIHEGPDLTDAGLKDIRDMVGVLSINAGAENNADNLTQNWTGGTANINLRGLGVASTLVLVNGRRQVLSSAQTDDGSSFVDLAALAPMLAVERVEILKDGAAAIYGSEAVAGVVNFITRSGYSGFELQTEFRARTNNGSQEDLTLDAVYGGDFGGGDGGFLVAASYLNRTSLLLAEVDWLRPATSGFGNPGSFNVPSLGRTVADPGCERYEGLLQQLTGGSEICRFDYGPQLTSVPNERRLQLWGQGDWNRGGKTALWAEVGYARNDTNREVSPSFPVLSTPVVPAYHPANPFGEDVFFQGRPYGYGHPPEINYYEHETLRVAAGLEGELTDSASWNLSVVYGANNALFNPRDVHAANFQAALNGRGGRGGSAGGCAFIPELPPGQRGCLFFNPFSSNFEADPGTALANGRELYEFIIGDYIGLGKSQLTTVEANVSGDLPAFGGGYAVGTQHRQQSLDFRYDSVTRQDGWAFLIGNPNFDADDSVYAVYGEVWLPLTDSLEVTGALRYEDYGSGVGNTLDPKVTLLYRPSEAWSLRGSYSTSFRAPSPFQTRGAQTNFTNIVDYDGSRTFAGRRTQGDPTLQPETSSAYNLGVTWQGSASWALNADFWRYEFEDVLRKENAQAIVNADPFDARIERTSAGTISIVNVAFINADRIETTGVDLSARGSVDTGAGLFSGWVEATWLLSYDVTNSGVEIDALGKLNRANVGAPNQEFRAAAGLTWTRGAWEVNGLVRQVGGYEDDGGGSIDNFTTLDANVRWSLGGLFGVGAGARTGADYDTTLTLGAANLLDEDPPYVAVAGSYDPRSADPRGRRVFLSVRIRTN